MQERDTGHMRRMTQADIDSLTPRERAGACILAIGQEVELNGGRLKVKSIGRKQVVLEGLPGTTAEAAR